MAISSRTVLLGLNLVLFPASVQAEIPVHQWSESFGTSSSDQASAVAVDASGNVILAGSFRSAVDFGGGFLLGGGDADIFIAKFDSGATHQWSRSFGAGARDEALAVTVDASGNVILAGYFEGTVDFGGGNLVGAGPDIFVAKFDSSGTHQWSKSFGDSLTDKAEAVAVDASGNVILAGYFAGMVDFGGGNLISAGSNRDAFVAKFDSSGVHQWSKSFGDVYLDEAHAVAVDASGNVTLAGYFGGSVDFGAGNLVSAGFDDIFIAKFDPSGVHQWSMRFGSSSQDEAHAVAVDASGNVILAGYFGGTVDFGGGNLVSAGFDEIFVAKFDPSATHQWSKSFGNTGSDRAEAVAVDASGDVILAGYFSDAVDLGGGNLVSAGTHDVFVAKFDTSGTHRWSRRFGDVSYDEALAVAVDASGNVIPAGFFEGTVDFGGGNLVGAGFSDIFVAKYAMEGSFDDGDLYLISRALGPLGEGIVRIDATSGNTDVLVDLPDTPDSRATLSYEPIRSQLIFANTNFTGGLSFVDANGVVTFPLPSLQTPDLVAARGDGIVYLWYGSVPEGFRYIDAGNVDHDLLDVAGTAQFNLGANGLDEMIYDPVTNSLICFDGTSSLISDCADGTMSCALKIPLTPDGTRVAGPVVAVQADISAGTEIVEGVGYGPGGEVFWVVDSNTNNQEPRMQLLDTSSMTSLAYASNGYYIGAATTNAGTFSSVRGQAVILDTSLDALRAFSGGETGDGTVFSSGLSDAGAHEEARLVEIGGLKPTAVEPPADRLPVAYRLEAAIPNPFNPSTTIRFELPQAGRAELTIYDVAGRRVRTLVRETRAAGRHEVVWRGEDERGRRVASGVYVYSLKAGSFVETRRMTLLK